MGETVDSLPERILGLLDQANAPIDSVWLESEWGIPHQKIVGAIKSLEALGMMSTKLKLSVLWY